MGLTKTAVTTLRVVPPASRDGTGRMNADLRTALRTLAERLPPGTPVPVPADQLLALLSDAGPPIPALSPPPDESLLTAAEAAERLRVPVAYIYRHPKLPFLVRVGRKVRASPARLARYLERQR